jgi:hypothetical protein
VIASSFDVAASVRALAMAMKASVSMTISGG